VAAAPASPAPPRKVKYWITKCLPTLWTPLPPEAKPEELYIYRPDFFQDMDGIQRRVAIWLDPELLKRTKHSLASLLGGSDGAPSATSTNAAPVVPAVPAGSDVPVAKNPFRSSMDETYHGSGAAPAGPSASTKKPAPSGATNPAPNPSGP
jgi:hypothetical protein